MQGTPSAGTAGGVRLPEFASDKSEYALTGGKSEYAKTEYCFGDDVEEGRAQALRNKTCRTYTLLWDWWCHQLRHAYMAIRMKAQALDVTDSEKRELQLNFLDDFEDRCALRCQVWVGVHLLQGFPQVRRRITTNNDE